MPEFGQLNLELGSVFTDVEENDSESQKGVSEGVNNGKVIIASGGFGGRFKYGSESRKSDDEDVRGKHLGGEGSGVLVALGGDAEVELFAANGADDSGGSAE